MCEDCLRLMLDDWLSQLEPVPCWEAVTDALFNVGNEEEAKDIRDKYCPQHKLPIKTVQQSNPKEEPHLWQYARQLKSS